MIFQNVKQISGSLWSYKSFSLVNIAGLSIGIAAITVIFLIADHEKSFDAFRVTGILLLLSKEFFAPHLNCINNSISHCMVCHEQMAAAFSIQNQYQMVDICTGGLPAFVNCIDNCEFPGNKSSGG